MRTAVFVDTSAWLAVLVASEPRHDAAVAAYTRLLRARSRLVTTNLVLAEMHALVVRARGVEAGVELLERVHADPYHEVYFVDRDLDEGARQRWLRVYQDQRFSLTDAVSFELMHRERIKAALATDRHFAAAGFELLPG